MEVRLKEIASLFSPDSQWHIRKFEETFKSVNIEFVLGECDYGSDSLNDEPDFLVPERDAISISLLEDGEIIASYYPKEGKNWGNFVDEAKRKATEDNSLLVVDVKKGYADHRTSIYYEDELLKYLREKTIENALGLFDKEWSNKDYVIYEVQGTQVAPLKTCKFAFVKKGDDIEIPHMSTLPDVKENSKKICTNNLQVEHLLPDYFVIDGKIDKNDHWQRLIANCGQILLLCYLADYSKIGEGNFEYKINGYKTILRTISATKVQDIDIPVESLGLYFQIYKWLYQGGNIYDKITIIRNIITLNIEDDGIGLKETTFDSIMSNYNIFEKKNVEQYISLRNNVAVQLRAYQKEIIDAVTEYENGMRTMFFGYLTFLFTTVIIRVMAKNVENAVLIPDTIIVLLLLYCGVSLMYQSYTRSILNGKIGLLDKQYNDTRNFYGDLLSEKELNELFTDQRNDDGTYITFLKEREVHFDMLWLGLNVLTIIALICVLIFVNH